MKIKSETLCGGRGERGVGGGEEYVRVCESENRWRVGGREPLKDRGLTSPSADRMRSPTDVCPFYQRRITKTDFLFFFSIGT